MKWARGVLGWRYHAVDETADHPRGLYRAKCGHLLMSITVLHTVAPIRGACQACEATMPRPLDHIWRALPGEPMCADGATDTTTDRYCVLVADHGRDIDHTARDGATW